VFDTTFTDLTTPSPGEGFIYTVAYVDEDFEHHGGIGVTGSGEQRTPPPPCP
jgi:hypothetical protein